MIVCETEKLTLREFSEEDAEGLFRIYSDAETMRFLGGPPASVDEERGNIRNHIERFYRELGFGLWAVVLKSEARLVGRCGILLQAIEGKKRPELAYLMDRSYWGRGLATEAANAVVEAAAARYGFEEMIAVISRENKASIRIAEKCGFGFERGLDSFKDFGPVSIYSRKI